MVSWVGSPPRRRGKRFHSPTRLQMSIRRYPHGCPTIAPSSARNMGLALSVLQTAMAQLRKPPRSAMLLRRPDHFSTPAIRRGGRAPPPQERHG
jgi:hypothetical protein